MSPVSAQGSHKNEWFWCILLVLLPGHSHSSKAGGFGSVMGAAKTAGVTGSGGRRRVTAHVWPKSITAWAPGVSRVKVPPLTVALLEYKLLLLLQKLEVKNPSKWQQLIWWDTSSSSKTRESNKQSRIDRRKTTMKLGSSSSLEEEDTPTKEERETERKRKKETSPPNEGGESRVIGLS